MIQQAMGVIVCLREIDREREREREKGKVSFMSVYTALWATRCDQKIPGLVSENYNLLLMAKTI